MNTIKKSMNSVSAAAVAVMLVGGLFAFASQSEYQEPNMSFDHINEVWEPLAPGTKYTCESAPTNCVGYSPDLTEENLEEIQEGAFELE